jgi:uncharacterized membrane-anchored protein
LKNLVRRAWDESEQQTHQGGISDQDKQHIRAHLLPAIVETQVRAIRSQLQTALVAILESDFPQKWPTYADDVASLLANPSASPAAVYAGLVGMLSVVKIYQYVENHAGHNEIRVFFYKILPHDVYDVDGARETNAHL